MDFYLLKNKKLFSKILKENGFDIFLEDNFKTDLEIIDYLKNKIDDETIQHCIVEYLSRVNSNWKIERDNDVGFNDESYSVFWKVTNDILSFTFYDEYEAKWLLNLIEKNIQRP